ncbi:hypothetical protein QNI19_08860 [Cytophagaceae bacterium DM2B3-1]|uniref:SMI1/KNR4 family protein n=1 Tax=Xanthocytophaga flava TaxID=3048013 RepID=A0ABT7CHN3_9BACT|nr:hypothetical protein [Xanthocytophaga flavus]MDJ1493041.1 hypothetical protein [Xanthocytophaga flavus]
MATPFPQFSKKWYFFGLPSVRPTENTYESFDYEALPPLNTEKLDGSLQWLQAIATSPQRRYLNLPPEMAAWQKGRKKSKELPQSFLEKWSKKWSTIEQQASMRKLVLPSSFITAMQHPEWLNVIDSPTDCFFELDENGFIDLKDREGECLLHFYSDSQYCLLWYLHFDSFGKHRVVVSKNSWFQHLHTHTFLPHPEVDVDEDIEKMISEIEAGSHTFLCECAPDFESFLYRVWIEGDIYYAMSKLYKGQELTPEQKEYLHFYEE